MKKCLCSTILFLLILLSHAQDRRLALVIGNADYLNSGQLKNPVKDANLMAETLESLDFEVIKKINATKGEMEKSIYDFSIKLTDYNVALFYYAGHGIQVEGSNYLLPIDAKLNNKVAAQFEAVDVGKVVKQFERYPENVNIVILDACRNNPFKTWSRGGSEGFKAIPAPSGTIIAFATGEGATASDGSGENGLYTSALVEEMKKPQRIEDVFIQTRVKVRDISENKQSPQEWSQLTGKFYFNHSQGKDKSKNSVTPAKTKQAEITTLDRGQLQSGYQARVHIADLLDFGYSVAEVMESGIPTKYLHGVKYQGGLIFHVDLEKNQGLIAAPFDQARGTKVTYQEANQLCDYLSIDGYDDWKLPSRGQLILLYKNLKEANFGDFTNDSYWSSSKSGYNNAWGITFSSGGKYDFDKLSKHHARAVRIFTLDK